MATASRGKDSEKTWVRLAGLFWTASGAGGHVWLRNHTFTQHQGSPSSECTFTLILPDVISLSVFTSFFFFSLFPSVEFRQLFQLFQGSFITNLYPYGVIFLKPIHCASSSYFRLISWSKNSCLSPVFSHLLPLAFFVVLIFFYCF